MFIFPISFVSMWAREDASLKGLAAQVGRLYIELPDGRSMVHGTQRMGREQGAAERAAGRAAGRAQLAGLLCCPRSGG